MQGPAGRGHGQAPEHPFDRCTQPRTGWQYHTHPAAHAPGVVVPHAPGVVVAPVQLGAGASAARRPHAVVAQASAAGHHVGARQ
ncbi:hypothetical protein C1280_27045 [Gemmata obscuriglobus]|uniref:Uncharacterized protein n=1 Tax=Gemmata obscuriglobus TaxID=114 RepID=A0A2Z3H3F8_9BACT|nr:hypothetical protein C1280_27045 [Gemmata obscuriglobus]